MWSEARVVKEFSVEMIGTTVPVGLFASIFAVMLFVMRVTPATVMSRAMTTAMTVMTVNILWSLNRRAASYGELIFLGFFPFVFFFIKIIIQGDLKMTNIIPKKALLC